MNTWPAWFSITPCSAIDLAVLVLSFPLTLAFYFVYWRISRRRIDLIFANCLLCITVMALGFFLEDNTESPLVALRWARINLAMVAAIAASFLHFVFEFTNEQNRRATWVICGTYGVMILAVVVIFSPYCYQLRTAPIEPRSWSNVSPGFPDANAVQAGLIALFFGTNVYTLVKLRAAIVARRIEERSIPRAKLLLRGTFVLMLLLVLDYSLYAFASIFTVSFGLLGFLAMCLPAALALGEQAIHNLRLKEALSKYVSPQVTDEILSKGLLLEARECDATVLFADIRDFTLLAQELGPKGATRFLSQYLNTMAEVIFRHHGMLIQTVGDGMLAVFGTAPNAKAHELSAVTAAFDMLAALDGIDQKRASEGAHRRIRIGIGLHSGQVMVGNVGGNEHVDYRVTGSVVNIASRVERHTKVVGCALLVTDVVHAKIQSFVSAQPAGKAPIRGKDWSIPVLAVTGLRGSCEQGGARIQPRYQATRENCTESLSPVAFPAGKATARLGSSLIAPTISTK